MNSTGDDGFDAADLDPDAVLWVRGVNYLAAGGTHPKPSQN